MRHDQAERHLARSRAPRSTMYHRRSCRFTAEPKEITAENVFVFGSNDVGLSALRRVNTFASGDRRRVVFVSVMWKSCCNLRRLLIGPVERIGRCIFPSQAQRKQARRYSKPAGRSKTKFRGSSYAEHLVSSFNAMPRSSGALAKAAIRRGDVANGDARRIRSGY